jgi:transcriptional regulator with XRE-family HTH domain
MNKPQFWHIVKKEVDKQHTTFEWLYRKTGIPKGTFASWKNRNIIPRADEAYRIAEALDVSLEYLLTGMDTPKQISNPMLQEILETLISLDDKDLQAIKALVSAMSVR